MNDTQKAAWQILAIGTVGPLFLYVAGLHWLSAVSLGFIPFAFAFVGWWLSRVLTGTQGREISANLTTSERNRLNEMARAHGRMIGSRLFPAAAITFLVCLTVMHFQRAETEVSWQISLLTNGEPNQIPFAGLCSIVLGISALISLPACAGQYKRTRAFLLQTEYAKQKGYS